MRSPNLDAGYGGTQVLWQTSIRVGDGEVVALMGPNGSGKSTLMNSISGLVRIWSGEIVFDGMALHASAGASPARASASRTCSSVIGCFRT